MITKFLAKITGKKYVPMDALNTVISASNLSMEELIANAKDKFGIESAKAASLRAEASEITEEATKTYQEVMLQAKRELDASKQKARELKIEGDIYEDKANRIGTALDLLA